MLPRRRHEQLRLIHMNNNIGAINDFFVWKTASAQCKTLSYERFFHMKNIRIMALAPMMLHTMGVARPKTPYGKQKCNGIWVVYASTHMYVLICIYVCICVCVYATVHAYIHTHICMCVYMCVCVRANVYQDLTQMQRDIAMGWLQLVGSFK